LADRVLEVSGAGLEGAVAESGDPCRLLAVIPFRSLLGAQRVAAGEAAAWRG
jgi:hypothetical protein